MNAFGAGIRRGVMGGDQFTQIANGLFRDSRLSFKAKGLFGLISTHRTGWQVTVADLVRTGPDGRDAVRAGLNELQKHHYLVREQLRQDDGTLGKIVYAITDRPALLDTSIEQSSGTMLLPAPAGSPDPGFGAGIRRGVMGGDQFTQIANGLFRDSRLSFKAKGLFGLISTHRTGWQVTVADLARRSRDGEAAVKSGLKELEKYGFLLRERDRNPDGTLGPAAYFITDLPSLQNSRSQPVSAFPPVDNPTSDERPTKNTNRKKTTQQKNSPLPPGGRSRRARPRPETDRTDATANHPEADLTPGVRLLLEIATSHPELLLTGKALTDQGHVATEMMNAGWSREQLHHIVTGRPLPHPVRTSVGAIISARLRTAQAYPPPASLRNGRPAQDLPLEPGNEKHATTASRTVTEALTYRALTECAGCGAPGIVPGEDLCPACLGWPPCQTCVGPTPRRAHPDGDGRCSACTTALSYPTEGSAP
jgi:hypothetical protein